MRRAELRYPSAPKPRSARIVGDVMLLGMLLVGCSGERANSHYRYPREAGYGRTSTCPDVRLPPLRDGNVSPDAARCSFADANGARVTHLAGKVLAEGGPGDPGQGVSGVKVSVHALAGPGFDPATPGRLIAHGSTDAQGNYSLRGVFVPAEYAIVVKEPTGETITYRIVRVEDNAIGEIKDLHVLIPVDPRLKAESAEPPPAHLDARLHHSPATPATPATSATPIKPPPPGVRMRPPESRTAPRQ